MEFGRDSNLPNQFRYTFDDNHEKEMTTVKHSSRTSKMDFGNNLSPPKQFRYTFEDKREEEMTSAKSATQT